MLHILCMWLLDGMGFFHAVGLCLSNIGSAVGLHFPTTIVVQSSSASLIRVVQQASASLTRMAQWAFASLMAAPQWAFASLMASVASASLQWRAISKSETCFHWQVSRDVLVISRCPTVLFISSWSKVTFLRKGPLCLSQEFDWQGGMVDWFGDFGWGHSRGCLGRGG